MILCGIEKEIDNVPRNVKISFRVEGARPGVTRSISHKLEREANVDKLLKLQMSGCSEIEVELLSYGIIECMRGMCH